MIQVLPSKRRQTAVDLPCESTATLDETASWPASDRSTGSDQEPPAGRSALWMIQLLPSKRSQDAVAFPFESTATWGSSASCPATERSTGSDQSPPSGRPALWMIQLLPSKRSQTAVELPCWSMVTLGLEASWPGADKSSGASHVGTAAEADAASVRLSAERPKATATDALIYAVADARSSRFISVPCLPIKTYI